MIVEVSKELADAARGLFLQYGFTSKHERIFEYEMVDGGVEYKAMVGLEYGDEDYIEYHFSFLARSLNKNEKSAGFSNVRVIQVEDTPNSFQQKIEDVATALESL